MTSAAVRSTSRRWKSATASSRWPRPTVTPTSVVTTGTTVSWIGSSASSRPSPASISPSSPTPCSASRKRPRRPRSRSPRTQEYEINLPFVTRRPDRSEAHPEEAHPRQARAAHRRPLRAHDQAGEGLLGRRQVERQHDRRARARRRHDPHAEGHRDRAHSSSARSPTRA